MDVSKLSTPKPGLDLGKIVPKDVSTKIAANSKLPPSLMSRAMRSPVIRGNPISTGASLGAAASSGLGYLATQTAPGRELGKEIGKLPGAQTAANYMRKAGEFIGVREPSKASTPAAPAAAPSTGRTGVGMNKAMNRVGTTPAPVASASKPAAAPASAPKPAAAPASAPAKSSYFKGGSQGDYTIKRGDTLSGIAKRTGQSVSDLASMNKISDVNKISSGAKLMTKVPTPPSRPADISKPAEPAASKPYKPVSPDTDIDRKISSAGVTIGTVKTPTAADDPDATGYTSREYGSKVSRDFNDVRPQSSPQSSSPAPEPAKPAAPAPEPKKKEAGAAPAAPMAESVVTVGANKYRIV